MMIGNACPHQIKAKTFAMEAENKTTLPDVQSSEDERNIAINRVGVRGIRLPVIVAGREAPQHTVADITPPTRRERTCRASLRSWKN